MTDSPSRPLTHFQACWVAEAVRLHELENGRVAAVMPARVSEGADAAQEEAWLLTRAVTIGTELGLVSGIRDWTLHARLVFLVLCCVAAIGGVVAAQGFFGNENRAVNVIWTLLGLIGFHLLVLLLWLSTFLAAGSASGGAAGRLWLWLVDRWPFSHGPRASAPQATAARALASMMNRSGMGQWLLGLVSHSLWLLALTASLLTMLVALSLRSYGFVLETTILPPDVFDTLILGFSWLPSQVGFASPDEQMIAAALAGDIAAQSETTRRAWSSWLSGGLIVYAIFPRLLVWAAVLLRLLTLRARLGPDRNLPGHVELLEREARPLHPGIVDGAPVVPAQQQVAEVHRVKGRRAVLVALELGRDIVWPPLQATGMRGSFTVGEVVESREQRRSTLAQLALDPPARLLLACDARLSPDRGTLHWLVELSRQAGELRVWLLLPERHGQGHRLQVWRDTLAGSGLAAERVITDQGAAFDWLNFRDQASMTRPA